MHSTRPKSSKGRSRPPVDQIARDTGERVTQSEQNPAAARRAESGPRSRSHSVTRITTPPAQDSASASRLQYVPAQSPLSLNKYMVLPSIKQSDVGPANVPEILKTSKMKSINICGQALAPQRRNSHREPGCSTLKTPAGTCGDPAPAHASDECVSPAPPTTPPDPDPNITMVSDETAAATAAAADRLLLAVRAPCGRRFQQHFACADTLRTLIACAEARNETSYEDAFVETMDVPRRTFRRLDMTLAECCVLTRSVLCISQEVRSVDTTGVADDG